MAEVTAKPESGVTVREFPGMSTKIDRHDLPTGMSQVQVNMQSYFDGKMTVRSGYRVVKFEG